MCPLAVIRQTDIGSSAAGALHMLIFVIFVLAVESHARGRLATQLRCSPQN
jgi:hypothetical protein